MRTKKDDILWSQHQTDLKNTNTLFGKLYLFKEGLIHQPTQKWNLSYKVNKSWPKSTAFQETKGKIWFTKGGRYNIETHSSFIPEQQNETI